MSSTTQYRPPNASTVLVHGSTANIWKHPTQSKVVIKAPVERWWESCEPRGATEKVLKRGTDT
jgi:hypothetical protein